jgi:hypothetical protein
MAGSEQADDQQSSEGAGVPCPANRMGIEQQVLSARLSLRTDRQFDNVRK